jgi:hypothetical protein
MSDSIVQFKTQSGKPIQVGNRIITVRSRALQVKFPGLSGGIIWNRPTSVLVQTTDGREQILPVRDTTRMVQLFLAGLGLLSMLVLVGKSRSNDIIQIEVKS